MKLVEEGNLDVNMEIVSEDEVGQLAHGFNQMVKEIRSLINRIYETEREKRQVELQMLQQQINPHFLYNTLDSINWMARMQNASNISSSITALIKLLRTSIHNGNDFNTIRDEVEGLRNYVEIQRLRYGDKLDVQFEIEEGILDHKILKLLLQPLLENAIHHGLDSDQDTGFVLVTGRQYPGMIEFRIEDYGRGMTEEEISQVMTAVLKKRNSFSGIGISNILQRMKLYYGEKYGLTFHSEPGKGLKAKLTIPVIPDGNLLI
jgi:two-component system sensor histidine kinase YesM